mgnify:CR=1 FL=1
MDISRLFIDGNEAVARAAHASGCTFFAGYPITPATTIYHHMLDLLPPGSERRGAVLWEGRDLGQDPAAWDDARGLREG